MKQSNLLVLEDDADLREAMCSSLEDEGYQVTGAANGVEALRLLRAGVVQPQAILLDLMMPIMDGWEFHEIVQKDRQLSQIPIIVLSAHGDFSSLDAALFLRKPVSVDQLLGAVVSVLRSAATGTTKSGTSV